VPSSFSIQLVQSSLEQLGHGRGFRMAVTVRDTMLWTVLKRVVLDISDKLPLKRYPYRSSSPSSMDPTIPSCESDL